MALLFVFVFFFIYFAAIAWEAFFIMTGLGILHHYASWCPPLGFWTVSLLCIVFGASQVINNYAKIRAAQNDI